MSDTLSLIAANVPFEEVGSEVAANAAGVAAESSQSILVSVQQQIITNDTFLAWVLLATVAALFTTGYGNFTDDIYRRYFGRPPYVIVFEIVAFVADVLMAASIIYYIYTQRYPVGNEASSWYAAIFGLWFAFEGLKYFWFSLFWRWGRLVAGVICAAAMGVGAVIVLTVLVITTGYRASWATFGLALVAWLIYLGAVIFNCWVAYQRWHETPEMEPPLTQNAATRMSTAAAQQPRETVLYQNNYARNNHSGNNNVNAKTSSNGGAYQRTLYPTQQRQQQQSNSQTLTNRRF